MKNKINENEQLARMKSLMTYGLKTEGKDVQYSSVEYQKLAADGKVYGIVREGTKYYIKTAPNKKNLVKESFDYIGGFRNRKDNEYSNFALAQKQFDLKMMSLKEATNKKDFSVESWDLNKKEKIVTEATDKMKGEILRERQIMRNTANIQEKKGCEGIDCEIADTQKDNIKSEKPKTGDAKKAMDYENPELPKEMQEGKEVLAWHDSHDNPKGDTYLDKSKGTEIGSSAPFDEKKGKQITDGDVVEEGESMHDSDCQNTPSVGVGNVGKSNPFNGKKGKKITEEMDDTSDVAPVEEDEDLENDEPTDDLEGGDEPIDGDGFDGGDESIEGDDFEGDDEPIDDDDFEDDDDDEEVGVYEDDMESRMSSVEDLLSKIAEKLGVSDDVDDSAYDDDDLFSDDDSDDDDEENVYDVEMDDDNDDSEDELNDETDMDMPMESRRYGRGTQIYETRAFRNAMRRRMNEEGPVAFTDNGRVPSGNMNKLNDFGKHPAYQKKVMTLPNSNMQEFPGYYDMNDDSVRNENPYGEKIGDSAPFEIAPETIDNAISEAFNRLKKKSNRR